jgi:hypothetical protein
LSCLLRGRSGESSLARAGKLAAMALPKGETHRIHLEVLPVAGILREEDKSVESSLLNYLLFLTAPSNAVIDPATYSRFS